MAPANDLVIRKAEDRDLEDLLSILAQLGSTSPLDSALDNVQRAWHQIQSQPDRALLVAEVRGRVVGTIDCSLTPNLTHDARSYITIENFVVDSAHRRRGVGTALLNAVIEQARRTGCYKIQLQSDIKRLEAHRLYEAVGFKASAQGYRIYL
jgi:GNAT superfamily N-acetyltransferase